MPATIADTWAMLWQNNVEIVVMLCDMSETTKRGTRKCEQYVWRPPLLTRFIHAHVSAKPPRPPHKRVLACNHLAQPSALTSAPGHHARRVKVCSRVCKHLV